MSLREEPAANKTPWVDVEYRPGTGTNVTCRFRPSRTLIPRSPRRSPTARSVSVTRTGSLPARPHGAMQVAFAFGCMANGCRRISTIGNAERRDADSCAAEPGRVLDDVIDSFGHLLVQPQCVRLARGISARLGAECATHLAALAPLCGGYAWARFSNTSRARSRTAAALPAATSTSRPCLTMSMTSMGVRASTRSLAAT